MKLNCKTSLAFKKYKPAEKPPFGSNVIAALSPQTQSKQAAAAAYPEMPVPVADLQTINDALAAAITAALTGNHSSVAAVKAAIAAWNNAFTLTANYVTSIANCDESIIRSAGFVPTKSETTPTQKPGAVTGFKATINGSKGAIIAGSKTGVPEAGAYLYSALPDGADVTYNGNTMIITVAGKSIYIMADTHRQAEFYNLPSGVPYNVSVYAVNRAGSGPAATSQQVITQ